MNRKLLIIYTSVFLLIGVMLYLYRSSYNDMKIYIHDVNRVNRVINRLERLDALVQFWINNENVGQERRPSRHLFIAPADAYDSILVLVENIKVLALYQEQRLRIDSVKWLVKEYQGLDEKSDVKLTPTRREEYRRKINAIIQHAFTFANLKLEERKRNLNESTGLLDKWLFWMLISAGALITLATFYSFNFLEQRRKAEGFSRTLLETMNNGVVSFVPLREEYITIDYKITYCNEAALKLLRIGDWRSKTLSQVVSKTIFDDLFSAFEEVLRTGVSKTMEGYLEHRHERNWLQATIAPLDYGILVSIYNLNPMMSYQQQLTYKIKQLEIANEELQQYAYVTSHDLQEPLRKIQMFSDIGINVPAEDGAEKKNVFFNKILGTANHMRELVQTLLNFTRSTDNPAEWKKVDLEKIVKASIAELDEMINDTNAQIHLPSLPSIQGSEFHLKLLFSNLILNALKYSKPDSVPVIEIRERRITPQEYKRFPGLDQMLTYTRISVQDNGVGFPARLREKIFTIFQRLHNKENTHGSGIGLAICRKIVHQHHGLIYARGKEGRGATFYIFLPLEQPREELGE